MLTLLRNALHGFCAPSAGNTKQYSSIRYAAPVTQRVSAKHHALSVTNFLLLAARSTEKCRSDYACEQAVLW